jgi:hypothetical protein
MRVNRSVLQAVTLLLLASLARPALATGSCSFERGERGYQRDLKRLSTAARITSMKDLFQGKVSFTKSRLPKAGAAWRSWAEGKKRFSVDLGNGCAVEGQACKYRLPMITTTKLESLKLVQNGRSTSVMPKSKLPILLDHSSEFWYDDHKVTWNGPESRYAVLVLFHELGHVKDFARMSEAQRQEFRTIYDRKSNNLTLTRDQQRKMVGFERSAWAHALRQARQLKKEGFDFLGGSSHREVMQTVYGSLRFYYDYSGTRDAMPANSRAWPTR